MTKIRLSLAIIAYTSITLRSTTYAVLYQFLECTSNFKRAYNLSRLDRIWYIQYVQKVIGSTEGF